MLEQKIVDVLNQIQSGVTNYAPQVLQTALTLVRIQCLGNILLGFLCVVLSVPAIYASAYFIKRNHNEGLSAEMWVFFAQGVFPIISLTTSITALVELFNVWNWVGVFIPQLYLAHLLMQKVF